jgi:peptidoglycan-associated lipoprotein
MSRDTARISLTVAGLGLIVILVAGCPKTPVLVPETATGPSAPVPEGSKAPGATAARPASPSAAAYVATTALKDVHFAVDRSAIRPEDEAVLDANAGWIRTNAGAQILIEGHADQRGTSAHNRALAERRARATRDALVARGIEASRITIRGYGEERPVCADRTDSCWAKNRRAHFLVKQ